MVDIILTNASIYTLDPTVPRSQGLAILQGRVVALGTQLELAPLAGSSTRFIDVQKRLVLPGFNDAHVHFLSGGFQLSSVQLREAATTNEFAERIGRFASKLPEGDWITGGDWDHERWPDARLPTRQLIDPLTPKTPVFVSRLDGHMALANSLALQRAGITEKTADPPGGLIVRDPSNGQPTGLLKDAAMNLVYRVIPKSTFQEKLAAVVAASEHAAQFGVTSVQDVSAGADVGVYIELERQGRLKTRIYAASPLTEWHRLAATGVRAAFGNHMVRIGCLKGFSDGSLGSTTALFFEPYLDAPETRGLPSDEMFPDGAMLERALQADQAGLQLFLHAIGDRANHQVLTIFEELTRQNGPRDRRPRIEHAQHLRPQDLARFARAGVIASMQPYHAADDGRWAEKRIGPDRAKTTYAFRTLLDSGATLAFGSDWTVAPLNPMLGIAAAVTRQTLDGAHPQGWVPEQKITAEEAVRAYTVGSAYAEFAENSKGTLAPGQLADLIVLDQNLFQVPPAEIAKTRVLLTIIGGRVVYEAPDSFD